MRWTEIVYLISVVISVDSVGNQIETPTEKQIFANEFYIGQSEFYNAGVDGLKPEKQFEIYSADYSNEKKLKHNSVIYNIIRTEKRGDRTRVTCEGVGANG